ncbi:hypothetical protein [Micromonospora endolithica]|uniref:Flavin reductase n=1 Tax=Micromonospora endolithica TaxID=230091 RepID=A0A3A9ZL13_9ACTN|nr:hypothetical protein [Micromonospora endolithica]RKN49061.1 hypothetical protein D7223_05900 [Micromonospora endolithica]
MARERWPRLSAFANISVYIDHSPNPPPAWTCHVCGTDWPCAKWRTANPGPAERKLLLPVISGLLPGAIRDLRGRVDGPQPPEIVKRFLFFLPLSDDEALAIARRMR